MMRTALLTSLVSVAVGAEYSHELAKRLVNYAGATYCAGKQAIDDWTCVPCQAVPGFQNITQLHGSWTDARAIIGFDPTLQARIVAFMGTNANIATWIDDVLIIPSSCYAELGCEGCTCHPGFKGSYDSVAGHVRSLVSRLPVGPLIVTGHSLGGAQAVHFAIDMHRHGMAPDHVYTIGQPRVGNDAFAAYFDSLGLDHWRVTHHRDPVPHLPWRGLGSYSQVLREAYYEDANADGPTRLCAPDVAEDPECADQFNDELSTLFIADHWNYLGFSFAADVLRCIPLRTVSLAHQVRMDALGTLSTHVTNIVHAVRDAHKKHKQQRVMRDPTPL